MMVQLYGLMKRKNRELENDKIGMDSVRVLGRRVGVIAKILKIGLVNLEEEIEGATLVGFPNRDELKEKIEKIFNR